MNTLRLDIRHALRKLRQSPGFTLVAVLTLALGIGANTAIFSVVDAVLLRPLPMHEAAQLVSLRAESRGRPMASSALDFRDMQARTRSFSGMAAMDDTELNLTGEEGEPERLQGAQLTAEAFDVLGVRPLLGRTFVAGEDQPGRSRVVVLGHALWQRRFGADPAVLGRTVRVGGEPYTVVGVMGPGFDFPQRSQLWVPLTWEGSLVTPEGRGAHWLEVYARLQPGVSLEQARQDVAQVARQLAAEYPQSNTGVGATLTPLREALVGEVEPALLLLLGAVGLVLLIACANLSNLLLARAVSREGELSVRLALGASRGHLVRQLLVESLVLALAGAGAGLLVASWALDVLAALGPREIPRLEQVAIDGRVLAFSGALALLTTVLFGLVPALQASRVELTRSLKEVGRGGSGGRHRARSVLVVVETALAVVLLVGAGLLLRSFVRLQQVDPGFHPEGVLTLELSLPESGYAWASPATATFYDALLERVRGLPGVQAAGASYKLPLAHGGMVSTVQDTAHPEAAPGEEHLAQVRVVTAGYLETMRIPLKRGRMLAAQDGEKETRGVLLNEEAARRYWPGEDPLGRTVTVGVDFGLGRFGGRVVGVVGNVRHEGMAQEPFPEVYVPYAQARGNDMHVVVRTQGEPLALAPLVRAEVRALDAELPVGSVRTLESIVGEAVAQPRFYMLLAGTFAALALVLAALGISGVVSNAVSHRTRELGIRMALGAEPRAVLGLVLRQSLALSALGLGVGLLLAFAASRLLGSMLYTVGTTDVLTYLGVVVLLGGVALLSSLLPALRATRIDPIIALKHE